MSPTTEHAAPPYPTEAIDPREYPSVSVLLPVYNEAQYLGACLESIADNDYRGEFEVIVIDGNSLDGSVDIAEDFAGKHRNIRILHNPARKKPTALNLGLARAKGQVILRMDGHALYDRDYISQCIRLLQESGAANVGGVWRPTGRTQTGHAIALAMGSRFALGNSRCYYTKTQEYVESVSLGAWWKSTLTSLGGFDEECDSNEDYEINYRLRQKGLKVLVSPSIRFTYFAPASIGQLFKKFFHRGMWKVKCLTKHPRSLRWRQLIPPALVVFTAAAVLLVSVKPGLAAILALLYGATTIALSGILASRADWSSFLLLPVAFSSIHFGWGLGFLWGLFRFGVPGLGSLTGASGASTSTQ